MADPRTEKVEFVQDEEVADLHEWSAPDGNCYITVVGPDASKWVAAIEQFKGMYKLLQFHDKDDITPIDNAIDGGDGDAKS